LDHTATVQTLFGAPRAVIGVIHVAALPGTPLGKLSVREIAQSAAAEARIYAAAGFHALILENMHDRPYRRGEAGPEVAAAMAVIGCEVRQAVALPVGIQVLAGANECSLAVAHALGAAFVRVEGFVFAHVADEGLIESDAARLLRYRRAIGAESVRVFADIKKKHSAHAITADVGIAETARAAEFFLADGVIVSGIATGVAADRAEVDTVAAAVKVPTIIGSGITPENIADYPAADAFIVGSAVKRGGLWSNPLDERRARAVIDAFSGRCTGL